ncbi:hypothetical protein GOBAR_AA14788 [Gossypium barbadense]|uniref:Uncharacterized protein n=1 Tax=Gossypium barbadense TaxID=3634 RepID=A0A2P5XRD6_GOSBA|nr:hypothetical protein GOBAR_AA14788 [Gossypium barbadense]
MLKARSRPYAWVAGEAASARTDIWCIRPSSKEGGHCAIDWAFAERLKPSATYSLLLGWGGGFAGLIGCVGRESLNPSFGNRKSLKRGGRSQFRKTFKSMVRKKLGLTEWSAVEDPGGRLGEKLSDRGYALRLRRLEVVKSRESVRGQGRISLRPCDCHEERLLSCEGEAQMRKACHLGMGCWLEDRGATGVMFQNPRSQGDLGLAKEKGTRLPGNGAIFDGNALRMMCRPRTSGGTVRRLCSEIQDVL